ncbi:MAG: hypothetical protein E7534_00390 [Ruminococcaceae bacterium]|nr:hypothetical protein [Oscillospiraceae bacterium]
MKLVYQENWDKIKERLTLLWDNEILDRPVVSVRCLRDKNNPYGNPNLKVPKTSKEYYLDVACMIERNLDVIEKTYFGGDAYPVIFPGWGCGGHSKYLQSWEMYEKHTHYTPHTIWMDPVIDEYSDFDFHFDRNNPVFQAELQSMQYLAEESKGRYMVAMPDNCGSFDGLGNLRNNEDLIVDLMDQPEEVKMASGKLVDALIRSGDELFEAVRRACDGGSAHGWMGTWSPGKHMQLQCDLSVMISPAMYQEFILEEIERTTAWLDHSIYHLDGIEQARFLDFLLSVKKLNMIQWTQVEGQPDVTQNFHHIRRIQKAGKGVVLIIDKCQLEAVLDNTSPNGRMLIVNGADDPQEADAIVDYVAKHSFQRKLY